MAKYKVMEEYKPIPEWSEFDICLPGKVDSHYTLNVAGIRIAITPEEKQYILDIWSKIDSGELEHD